MEDNKEELNESRALIGGSLESKEKTEYEDWLEEIHKKLDKSKGPEMDTKWGYKLFDKDCGSNGYHSYDGTPIKLNEFPKIFAEIFKASNN